MQFLTTTGARILFAIPFLVFGLLHLMMGADMGGMVPGFVPGGVIWVYITGLALIAAGVAVVTKKMGALAMKLLALLLLAFILTVHLPAMMNPATMMTGMSGLLKDIGLLGGALTFAGIFEKENV